MAFSLGKITHSSRYLGFGWVIELFPIMSSVYVDDVLVAENFGWRNPGNHKALGWLMFGFDRGKGGTIGYYDDVVFGEGDVFFQSVAPGDRLTTTWGRLRNAQ